MAEEEKLKFPLVWNKCPNCGSEKRVVGTLRNELVAEGKWRPEVEGVLMQQITRIADPARLSVILKIPMLLTWIDACAECGTLYCIKIDCQDAPTHMLPETGPKPAFPQRDMRPFGFAGGNIKAQ